MNKETKKALTFIWNKRNKLYAEGDKLYAEGNKLWAEGSKLYAEGDKIRAEGDKLYAEGIIHHCGNVLIEYTEEGCIVDGELFKNP